MNLVETSSIALEQAWAHPLYSVNSKLTIENFKKGMLLFKNHELNWARSEEQNECL